MRRQWRENNYGRSIAAWHRPRAGLRRLRYATAAWWEAYYVADRSGVPCVDCQDGRVTQPEAIIDPAPTGTNRETPWVEYSSDATTCTWTWYTEGSQWSITVTLTKATGLYGVSVFWYGGGPEVEYQATDLTSETIGCIEPTGILQGIVTCEYVEHIGTPPFTPDNPIVLYLGFGD